MHCDSSPQGTERPALEQHRSTQSTMSLSLGNRFDCPKNNVIDHNPGILDLCSYFILGTVRGGKTEPQREGGFIWGWVVSKLDYHGSPPAFGNGLAM